MRSCSFQGGWEDDEDVYQAACREAMEEAGVKGIIDVSNASLTMTLIYLVHCHCLLPLVFLSNLLSPKLLRVHLALA
jgi:8-oxo-dGTP pyrophosphatase MutT (NUDIX family)